MITKDTARINWNKNAKDIYNLVRGLYPVPRAFATLGEEQFKITKGKYGENFQSFEAGKIIEIGKDYIRVKCGENTAFDILEIQAPGKRAMLVSEYLKGNSISADAFFN